jgi:hypothetical protein
MNTLIDRRILLFGVCAFGVAGTSRCLAAPRVGAVIAVAGSAFLERDSNRMPAAGGADVMLDDLALTGEASRLDLQLGRATRIKLGARSELKIDRFVAARAPTSSSWTALSSSSTGEELSLASP